jgi:hypothetical protein
MGAKLKRNPQISKSKKAARGRRKFIEVQFT